MIDIIIKRTPAFIKKYIKGQIKNYKARTNPNYPPKYFCPICMQDILEFKGLDRSLFEKWFEVRAIFSISQLETINISKYSCPNCGANDRDRLYALYLKKMLPKEDKIKLLDIAPTHLQNYIKAFPNVIYRSMDLYKENVDDKLDITDMNIYKDEQFDVFICSHVLEHVNDDVKALKELFRILKKDGWGILMVPVHLDLNEIYENPTITDPDERWKHFGQNDHVRMYSKEGFIERVKSVGFNISQYNIEYFGEDVFEKNGIHKYSVLYIVTK